MDEKAYYGSKLTALKHQIRELKDNSSRAPSGTLYIKVIQGSDRYYQSTNASSRTSTYLGQDKINTVKALAQKRYDKQLIKELEYEVAEMEKWIKTLDGFKSPDDILDSLPEAYGKLVEVPAFTQNFDELETDSYVRKWLSQNYKGVEIFDEKEQQLFTMKHELVKSKTEVMVADWLNAKNIPYLSEKPLSIPGVGKVYPDFTILIPKTRQEIYWEHCGMMENPQYFVHYMQKMNKYAFGGHVIGKDLIFTYESSTLGISSIVIESTINWLLSLM